ncbi:MAG: DUF3820 family protein [Planctomycetia bacterium]|nr:DUF3820 family protein [Planctomycetia bacterium]
MRMPFGKYAGELLEDIPDSYLLWLLSIELQPWLHGAVAEEVRSRQLGSPYRQDRQHAAPPVPKLVEVLGAVRKRLALSYHPDRGNDPGIMKGINLALDAVQEAIGA